MSSLLISLKERALQISNILMGIKLELMYNLRKVTGKFMSNLKDLKQTNTIRVQSSTLIK